ncbi:hypothetical protein HD554DRAFT_2098172 [Boletus coccyginus]|nr:hypothetical protein HD554DRAFT_2098172 [Boletus coccyginus]
MTCPLAKKNILFILVFRSRGSLLTVLQVLVFLEPIKVPSGNKRHNTGDGELMEYLELVYVNVGRYVRLGARTHMSSQENHVATYVPGGAKAWDRGMHVLVGEERFRGWERAQAWLRSIHHYIFLADPRTEHAMGEPKADNGAIMQLSLDSTMHIEAVGASAQMAR